MSLGGEALAGDIPVYTSFYKCYPRYDTTVNKQELLPLYESGFYQMSDGLNAKFGSVHPRTRASFMLAFGITPPEQRVLERHFDGVRFRYSVPELTQSWMASGEGDSVATLLSPTV